MGLNADMSGSAMPSARIDAISAELDRLSPDEKRAVLGPLEEAIQRRASAAEIISLVGQVAGTAKGIAGLLL